MAAFKPTEILGRFDFLLLRDGPVILYYDHGDLEQACEWLRKHTYTLYHFNCQQWNSSDDLYEDFYQKTASALGIAGCGNNRDAFRDCLFDFEVPDEGGAAFVFSS